MSKNRAPWVSLSGRVIRVALARKDVGYAELSRRLAQFGILDEERALAARVAVGRVRLDLFLKILHVTDSELPPLWQMVIDKATSWETWAKSILLAELNELPPVTIDDLARNLANLGAGYSHDTLVSRISTGNLSLPDFLKCIVILRSRSLDSFIEYRDLVSAARVSNGPNDGESAGSSTEKSQ